MWTAVRDIKNEAIQRIKWPYYITDVSEILKLTITPDYLNDSFMLLYIIEL